MSTEAVSFSESPVHPVAVPQRARWLRWSMPLLVLGTTLGVFWPVIHGEFLRHDDHRYIKPSELIGLDAEHLVNMLTLTPRGYCEPLTWLSYTFDLHVSELSARGVHATNLALHAIAALLVYALAVQLFSIRVATACPRDRVAGQTAPFDQARTAATYLGAGVAALLFAIHPLRTEAVAWASARAYPLAAIFALLAVLCYLRSVAPGEAGSGRRAWLGATVVCYGASLLSAPLAIALPFVLLVLDYYPLRRIGALSIPGRPRTWVLLEKLPLLIVLGLVAGLMPIIGTQADAYNSQFSASIRSARAAYSTVWGLLKTLWPSNLSPFYELPPGQEPSALLWGAAAAVMIGISVAALVLRKRLPAVAIAWFTWLLLFVPLSGLVRYGTQLAADRYTYLPGIVAALLAGAFVRWTVVSTRRPLRAAAIAGSMAVVLALSFAARADVAHWANTQALFRHALEINPKSHTALRALGHDYRGQSRYQEAEDLYRRVLTIAPSDYSALRHMASLRAYAGDLEDATEFYLRALAVHDDPDVRVEYAVVLARRGLIEEAADTLLPVMGPEPEKVDAFKHLATAVGNDHKLAVRLLLEARQLNPEHTEIMNNLAWLRATSPSSEVRNGKEAVELATRAFERTPQLEFLDTLAAAHAEAGDFEKAVEFQKKVISAGERMGVDTTAYRKHLKSFEIRRSVREPETMPAEEVATSTAPGA